MMFKKIRKSLKRTFVYELIQNYIGKSKKSFSENFGEDLFVNYFFQSKKIGFYVDIGCNLPKNRSLTYLLYKKRWNGIKVDISPRSIKLNKFLRKKDVNLNLSVGAVEKLVDSYIFYSNCSMNTVNPKFMKYTQKSVNKKPLVNSIQQLKLNTILEKYNVKKIDYINIDVEGHENEVISGFDIKKYLPELVSIEIHDKICPPINNRIYKYFIKNNYKLISIYGWTYFFSSKNSENIHFST